MRRRGSMTVEAAFVVPLSFFAVLVFMNLFLFLEVQIRVQTEIADMSRELMSVGTVLKGTDDGAEDEGGLINAASILRSLGAEGYLRFRMDEKTGKAPWLSHIKKGASGFSFAGSSLYERGSEIRIRISYSYVFDDGLFGVGAIPVTQQVVARGFSGVERTRDGDPDDDEEDEENVVFVAESGTVYHRLPDCTYLKPRIERIGTGEVSGRRNASGAKYYACEVCGAAAAGESVYITLHGTRYHTTISCRELLRTFTEMTEEEAIAKGLHACSKCGGTEP